MQAFHLIHFPLNAGQTRLSRAPSFTQRSANRKPLASALALNPLYEWPPRSGRPGSRWAGVWDITTRCGQLWLAAFLCGWTTAECVIRAECEGPCCLAFCCAGAWQEQLGHCTGFPLFMWGVGISAPHSAVLGPMHQLPLTVEPSAWKDTAKERVWMGWFPAKSP